MIHKPGMPGLKFEQQACAVMLAMRWSVKLQMGRTGGVNWHNSLPTLSNPDQSRSAFEAISLSLGWMRFELNMVPRACFGPQLPAKSMRNELFNFAVLPTNRVPRRQRQQLQRLCIVVPQHWLMRQCYSWLRERS